MYDWLLFLHVLAAFILVGTLVVHSAVALGAAAPRPAMVVARVAWDVGGIGTLVFGIWLALNVDRYEIWDAWIVGAIVLWLAITELGRRANEAAAEGGAGMARWHWLRTVATVGILVLMVWKPGA